MKWAQFSQLIAALPSYLQDLHTIDDPECRLHTAHDDSTAFILWLLITLCEPNTIIYGLLDMQQHSKRLLSTEFSHYRTFLRRTYLKATCEVLFFRPTSLARFYQLNGGAQVCGFDLSLESFHIVSTLKARCYSHNALPAWRCCCDTLKELLLSGLDPKCAGRKSMWRLISH